MKKNLVILLIVLLSSIALFAVEKDDIVGLWFMQEHEDDRGVAEVFEHNGKYYAVAIGYESYVDASTDVIVIPKDVHNPNPSLRNRPQNEVVFINEISFNGKRWKNGEIYDFASGKYAYVSGKLKNGDLVWRLSLDKMGVFGANTTWEKVEDVVTYDPFRKTAEELEAMIPKK